jgi:uncharacterized protein
MRRCSAASPRRSRSPRVRGVSDMLRSPTDWNYNEEGRYFEALADGDIVAVERFLDQYPDAMTKTTLRHMTPLIWTARYGHEDVAELLLARGAKIDAHDREGLTALMHAAFEGKAEVVNLLLAHGADAQLHAENGWTALMCAARSGDKNITAKLLEKGASVDVRNDKGETALDISLELGEISNARAADYREVAALLKEWPEKQRRAELEADIAAFSPALQRRIPAPKTLRLPKGPAA